jgi:hypothetical protein
MILYPWNETGQTCIFGMFTIIGCWPRMVVSLTYRHPHTRRNPMEKFLIACCSAALLLTLLGNLGAEAVRICQPLAAALGG